MKNSRVAFSGCSDYQPGKVGKAVESLLSSLDGFERLVPHGASVLVKPNLLTDSHPDEAVTTHPEVARAVIRLVRDAGGIPFVADSPANVVKIERVWERTGFLRMCDEESVPLVNLEKCGSELVESGGIRFTVARAVMDADLIISLPKVKTHMLMTYTGAVKNMYGVIPGFQKARLHQQYPTQSDFSRLLAALYTMITPGLSVADGIVGLEGNGPSSGGDPVALGFLAASTDAVALDTAVCAMLGLRSEAVPYLRELRDRGIGETRIGNIDLAGDTAITGKHLRIRKPATFFARMIPGRLARMLGTFFWIRPFFGASCVGCGRCSVICPAVAISMAHDTGRPVLDAAGCVGCCCCHEVCPERAIEMIQSPFLNFIRRGRLP